MRCLKLVLRRVVILSMSLRAMFVLFVTPVVSARLSMPTFRVRVTTVLYMSDTLVNDVLRYFRVVILVVALKSGLRSLVQMFRRSLTRLRRVMLVVSLCRQGAQVLATFMNGELMYVRLLLLMRGPVFARPRRLATRLRFMRLCLVTVFAE